MTEHIDTLIKGWYVVTMNPTRDVIRHGAVAIRGNQIIDVGKASDLEARYQPAETVGGDRFVVTPGLVNTHIHITGEPLTRGYVPDDTPFEGKRVPVAVPALFGVHRRRGAFVGPTGRGGDAQVGHHLFFGGGHHPVRRRGDGRLGRSRHQGPDRQVGVGSAPRAQRVSPRHR